MKDGVIPCLFPTDGCWLVFMWRDKVGFSDSAGFSPGLAMHRSSSAYGRGGSLVTVAPSEPVLREADGNGNRLSVALRKASAIRPTAVLQGGACRRGSYRPGQTPCD